MNNRSQLIELREFVALKRLERDRLFSQIDNPSLAETRREEAKRQYKVIVAELKKITFRLENAIESAKRAVAALRVTS